MTTLEYRTAPPAPSKLWILAILCAWIVGAQLWLLTDFWLVRSTTTLVVYAIAIAVCFIDPVQRGLLSLSKLLEKRGPIATPLIFVLIAVAAGALLYGTALYSNRRFSPVFHDEYSYLLQARMLASGVLSMPAHPLGAFFDTFYVITDRAYASQYFPGAALMFVPGVWLGLEGWVMPLAIASAAAAMLFLVIRELFDGICGLASVVILCGCIGFRFLAIVPVAQVPVLLLGLTATFATLRWIATGRLGWIVFCGTAIGWAAITRPLDAVVYAIPLGVLIVFQQVRTRAPAGAWGKLVAAGLLPLLPFLSLQLVINRQVTGSVFQTPFGYYAQRDLPGTSYGFHGYDPTLRPASPLPQKQVFYENRVRPAIERHTPGGVVHEWLSRRGKAIAGEMVGDMLLFVPVPVALLCLRDPRRWAVVSILLVWCLAYSPYVFQYAHYYVSVLPSVPVLIFAGFESLSRLFPSLLRPVRCVRAVLPSVIAVMVLPQFKSDVMDQFVDKTTEEQVQAFERQIPDPQAILLVRYSTGNVPEWEVVYNTQCVWPDDARVIRAHDLRQRNVELFRYYAQRQPQRVVYLFDRATDSFTRLGIVGELLKTSGSSGDSISSAAQTTTRPTATNPGVQRP